MTSRFPPAVVPLVSMAIGAGLHWTWPLSAPADTGLLPGVFLLVVALIVLASALTTMQGQGTKPEPWQPTSALVVTGPYKYSRSPIYLAFLLLQAGLGLVVGWLWILIMVVPTWLVLDRFVVRREEAELEALFGDDYNDYKAQVRRWF